MEQEVKLLIETWFTEYRAEKGLSAGAAVDIGDFVRWIALQHLLKQTHCSTLRELLEQKLKEEQEALAQTNDHEEIEVHGKNLAGIRRVLLMLEKRQPVA